MPILSNTFYRKRFFIFPIRVSDFKYVAVHPDSFSFQNFSKPLSPYRFPFGWLCRRAPIGYRLFFLRIIAFSCFERRVSVFSCHQSGEFSHFFHENGNIGEFAEIAYAVFFIHSSTRACSSRISMIIVVSNLK